MAAAPEGETAAPSVEAEEAEESVPTTGVAVWWLRRFADDNLERFSGGGAGGKPLSTVAVSGWPKASATLETKAAYVDLQQMRALCCATGKPAVGKAAVFASHAWSNSFLDFVAAMEAHLDSDSDHFVWNGAPCRMANVGRHFSPRLRCAISVCATHRCSRVHCEPAQRALRRGVLPLRMRQQAAAPEPWPGGATPSRGPSQR